jgi:hypothetical protein
MLKPICAKCERFFKPKKNGVAFEEGYGDGTRRPYKLWLGDLWECPNCEAQVIVGTGASPVVHAHEPGYSRLCESIGPTYFVDDC